MPEPVTSLVEWSSNANFPASVYPATLPWGDPHPSAGLPTPWSNNATKDAAGLAGVAANGHEPARPTRSPQFNKWLNIAWEWIAWLEENSDNPGNASKVLKTSAAGDLTLARLVAGGSTTGANTVDLTQPTSNGPCLQVTHDGTNFGMVVATQGGTLAGARFLSTGIKPALEVVNLGGGGPAAKFTGDSTFPGIEAFGDDSHAIDALGGAVAGSGVLSRSQSISPGLTGEGWSGSGASAGGEFFAKHIDASGGRGNTLAGATVNAFGWIGLAQGDGTGLKGQATDGYGIIAVSDTTGPKRASFRLAPQNLDPTTGADGDMFASSEIGTQPNLKFYRNGWKFVSIREHQRAEPKVTSGVSIGPSAFVQAYSAQMTTRTGGRVFFSAYVNISRSVPGNTNVKMISYDNGDKGGASEVVHVNQDVAVSIGGHGVPRASFSTIVPTSPASNADRIYEVEVWIDGILTSQLYECSMQLTGEHL